MLDSPADATKELFFFRISLEMDDATLAVLKHVLVVPGWSLIRLVAFGQLSPVACLILGPGR